jgi:dynactin complex subunit
MYPSILRNLKLQGWDVEVLYDPTEFLKEQEAKRLEMQELTFKQRQELEAKRKAAEREALKAEILAEMSDSDMMRNPVFKKALEDLQEEIEQLKAANAELNKKKEPKADGSKKTK